MRDKKGISDARRTIMAHNANYCEYGETVID